MFCLWIDQKCIQIQDALEATQAAKQNKNHPGNFDTFIHCKIAQKEKKDLNYIHAFIMFAKQTC